jgi:hypothetical protein
MFGLASLDDLPDVSGLRSSKTAGAAVQPLTEAA